MSIDRVQPEAKRFASKVIKSRVRYNGIPPGYDHLHQVLPSIYGPGIPSDFEPALDVLRYELEITATHALRSEQSMGESQG